MTLASLIRYHRQRLDLSPQALADKLGVHVSRIHQLERGIAGGISAGTALEIAKLFKIDPLEILKANPKKRDRREKITK